MESPERQCWIREEVDRHYLGHLVLDECPPGLRWWLPRSIGPGILHSRARLSVASNEILLHQNHLLQPEISLVPGFGEHRTPSPVGSAAPEQQDTSPQVARSIPLGHSVTDPHPVAK